jgi:hypothetical protein
VVHGHPEHLARRGQRLAVEGPADLAGAVDRGVLGGVGKDREDGLCRALMIGVALTVSSAIVSPPDELSLVPVLTPPDLEFIADLVPVRSLASITQQDQGPRLAPASSADRKRAMATGTPIGRVGAGSGLAAAAVRVWPQ